MRIKIKYEEFEHGETRVNKHFAIFPIIIKGDIRFFETIYYIEKFSKYTNILLETKYKWEAIEFITKEQYEKYLNMTIISNDHIITSKHFENLIENKKKRDLELKQLLSWED